MRRRIEGIGSGAIFRLDARACKILEDEIMTLPKTPEAGKRDECLMCGTLAHALECVLAVIDRPHYPTTTKIIQEALAEYRRHS